MACYNRVILMGNLTRDPELKQAPSGTPVVDLRLAVSEQYRDKQTGETKEVTCFVDVTAWSRLAELCSQYLSKGRPILVEGRLQYDEWKNKEGETRSKLRVRADIIRFLGSAQGAREGTPSEVESRPSAGVAISGTTGAAISAPIAPPVAGFNDESDDSIDDEDLPF